MITERQKLGLQYFDELQIPIPKDEMDVWNVLVSVITILTQATILAAAESVDVDLTACLVGS
jgi:hypothetical protein